MLIHSITRKKTKNGKSLFSFEAIFRYKLEWANKKESIRVDTFTREGAIKFEEIYNYLYWKENLTKKGPRVPVTHTHTNVNGNSAHIAPIIFCYCTHLLFFKYFGKWGKNYIVDNFGKCTAHRALQHAITFFA